MTFLEATLLHLMDLAEFADTMILEDLRSHMHDSLLELVLGSIDQTSELYHFLATDSTAATVPRQQRDRTKTSLDASELNKSKLELIWKEFHQKIFSGEDKTFRWLDKLPPFVDPNARSPAADPALTSKHSRIPACIRCFCISAARICTPFALTFRSSLFPQACSCSAFISFRTRFPCSWIVIFR